MIRLTQGASGCCAAGCLMCGGDQVAVEALGAQAPAEILGGAGTAQHERDLSGEAADGG